LQNKPQGFKSQAPLAESKMGKGNTPQPNDGKSKEQQAYVFEGGIRIMEYCFSFLASSLLIHTHLIHPF
jgi:hypothetical protein